MDYAAPHQISAGPNDKVLVRPSVKTPLRESDSELLALKMREQDAILERYSPKHKKEHQTDIETEKDADVSEKASASASSSATE